MAGFYQRFLESVQRWPAHVAIELQRQQGEPERLTYSDLRSQAEAAAAWLEQSSSADFRGTRCAILADNGPRWVAAYLGAIAAGGVAVPFDTAFSAAQVAKLLHDSGSGFLFTDSRHLDTAQKAADEVSASGLAVRLVLLDNAHDSKLPNWQQVTAKGATSFALPKTWR